MVPPKMKKCERRMGDDDSFVGATKCLYVTNNVSMQDAPWLDIPQEQLAKGLGYSRPHKPTQYLQPPPIISHPPNHQ